jgi:hypothetical protein
MPPRPSNSVIVVEKTSPASFPKPTEAIYIKPTKGSITLSMHRMFNLLLAKAHDEGGEKESYRVAVSMLGADLGTESKNVEFLKDTARKLTSTVVEWDVVTKQGKRKWGVSSMLASAELEEGGVLEYSFSKHIREKLLRPDVYARLNLQLQNKFRSRHGLALYEQCARYIDNPSSLTAQLPWSEWAAMLSPSAGASQYAKEWKYFARDLLKPAISEVNAIAENFSIEALIVKEGRRVSTLQFRLKRKQQKSLDLQTQAHLFDPQLRSRMEKLGVASAKMRHAFAEFEESSIRAALDYTERRLKTNAAVPIINPGAYFLDALKKRYGEPELARVKEEEGRAVTSPAALLSDLRGAFIAERARDAERMFDEQSKAEQDQAFASYIETLGSSMLKSRFTAFGPKDRKTKLSFFVWLAQKTWGDPSNEDLLTFAAGRFQNQS